jgi:hypothetical protein
MSFRTSITIVASPRPRVGKTLLARLLTDFHRHEGRPALAFDLNAGEGTLRQFLPGQAATATIGDIRGQMALFDALVADGEAPKIIDLGHETFEAFFALAEQIGFAEEARARGIAPAILFLLTPDRTSIEAYRNLRRRLPQVTMAPVHNEMFGLTQHRDKYPLSAGEVVVRLPALAPALRKYVETPPFSFADAQLADATGIPVNVHIELQHWLRRIYLEFRELDLRILLAGLQSSMRLGS